MRSRATCSRSDALTDGEVDAALPRVVWGLTPKGTGAVVSHEATASRASSPAHGSRGRPGLGKALDAAIAAARGFESGGTESPFVAKRLVLSSASHRRAGRAWPTPRSDGASFGRNEGSLRSTGSPARSRPGHSFMLARICGLNQETLANRSGARLNLDLTAGSRNAVGESRRPHSCGYRREMGRIVSLNGRIPRRLRNRTPNPAIGPAGAHRAGHYAYACDSSMVS